jgi:beta-lactamase class A
MTKQPVRKVICFSLVSVLLIGIGWFARGYYTRHFHGSVRQIKLSGFQYISPLLDVELPEGFAVGHEPIPFKYKVKQFVDEQVKSGKINDMSVYYRDLSDGPWFGINEKVGYNPASLMKIPLMITWLKRAEKDPSVLQRRITFIEDAIKGRPYILNPEKTLEDGVSYTIEELIRYMVEYSDNSSFSLLSSITPAREVRAVVASMDVSGDPNAKNYTVTVKSYSGFLRILYNASFLNKEMSEKALEIMSSQEFPYGIVAGIPKGVKLASKFGEYFPEGNPYEIQLHEFGIVYHPKGPYILGVLTRGNNWKAQTEIIKSISEIVYNSVNVTIADEYRR